MELKLVALKQVGLVITDLRLALRGSVEHLQVHHVAYGEAVVEEAEPAAHNGLRNCALLMSVEGIREGKSRTPVAVISDVVLRLPAQAAGESQIQVCTFQSSWKNSAASKTLPLKASLPVGVRRGLWAGIRPSAWPGRQRRSARTSGPLATPFQVSTNAETDGKVKLPLKFPFVDCGFAVVAHPGAELDGLLALGHGGDVLQLEMVAMAVGRLSSAAAARERARNAKGWRSAERSVVDVSARRY